jgi:hypothetical protein
VCALDKRVTAFILEIRADAEEGMSRNPEFVNRALSSPILVRFRAIILAQKPMRGK